MILEALYRHIVKEFSGYDNPSLEAKFLLQSILEVNASDFITNPNLEIGNKDLENVNKAVARRLAGEPLSKIVGVREFWGRDFIVNEFVLDPRPDTETLIEAVLNYVGKLGKSGAQLSLLDLGTGTGCIPLTLLCECPQIRSATAGDISVDALDVARQNAQKHQLQDRIKFVKTDWFEALPSQQFDIITSNPPYICESERDELSVEVKNHDPHLALFADENGLEAYKKIFLSLNKFLKPTGQAFFEIGANRGCT